MVRDAGLFHSSKQRSITLAVAAFMVSSLCSGEELQETMPEQRLQATVAGGETPKWDVYLSGYAHHDRDTYTKAQLRKMNETTWGGGLGRTIRNGRGNDESLYLIGMRDSHGRAQWMAGYVYQWVFPVSKKIEVGVGLTALLIRKHDWFDGRPFPAILPVASIGPGNTKLVASYVPKLSPSKAKGDIWMVMLKLSF